MSAFVIEWVIPTIGLVVGGGIALGIVGALMIKTIMLVLRFLGEEI